MCNTGSLTTAGNSRGSIWMSDMPLEMYRVLSRQNMAREITLKHAYPFLPNNTVWEFYVPSKRLQISGIKKKSSVLQYRKSTAYVFTSENGLLSATFFISIEVCATQ